MAGQELPPHIICAYALDGAGKGIPLAGKKIAKILESPQFSWVHLDATYPETRIWLQDNVGYLDPYIIDALLAEETRPRMTEIKDGMLVILRGVNLNENAEPEDMISVRLWIDQRRVISMRNRRLRATEDIQLHLREGKGPKDAGEFLSILCARLFERMEPVLRELDDRTDAAEENILENPDTAFRHEIIDIRKMAIILRRYIAPQRDVLFQIFGCDLAWLEPLNRRHIHESLDRVTRYVEDLDAIRERAQIIKDELSNIMADRMNKNMYVLSVVAAIFMPLGFITGLLGINVGGMPGASYDMAFWIVCGLCIGLALGLVGLFRLLKWI